MEGSPNNKLAQITGLKFFEALETHINSKIPPTLQNVLLINHYDSAIVLSTFDDDSTSEIQNFMRHIFVKEMLNENENMCDYLGRFTSIQAKFIVVSGDIRLIKRMVEICKRLYALQPSTSHLENTADTRNKT